MASPPPSASAKKQRYVDPAGFTPQFSWQPSRGGEAVQAEGVALARVAAECGTPTYLYSSAAIAGAYRELDRGLAGVPHTLCFAVKANGNLALLRMLARLGSGFDAVSGGEIELLRRAGVPGNRIVFSGVGKTREEMREALRYPAAGRAARRGILLFNVESEAELEVLLEEAARSVRGRNDAPAVSVRVNPDVQAGVLLTRVVYTKEIRGKRFVIVDAAMNDLMRPALYGAVHPVTPVTREKGIRPGPLQRADIVGPVCESGDCFLRDWPLPPVQPGDVLAIWCAGAYGMSLASNYNARRRPAEVLVTGRGYRLIRRRETLDDLLRAETAVLAKPPR